MSALAHKFLYLMFNFPRFIDPIFKMGRFNKFSVGTTLIGKNLLLLKAQILSFKNRPSVKELHQPMKQIGTHAC